MNPGFINWLDIHALSFLIDSVSKDANSSFEENVTTTEEPKDYSDYYEWLAAHDKRIMTTFVFFGKSIKMHSLIVRFLKKGNTVFWLDSCIKIQYYNTHISQYVV